MQGNLFDDFPGLTYIGSDYTCYRKFYVKSIGGLSTFYHNAEHFAVVKSRSGLLTRLAKKGVEIARSYSFDCPGGIYLHANSSEVTIPYYAYSSISGFKRALSRLLNVPLQYLKCYSEYGLEKYYVCRSYVEILPYKVDEWVRSRLSRV